MNATLAFFIFDPMYFVFLIPAVLISLWAQMKVKSTYAAASKVRAAAGLSGAETARAILDAHGLNNVRVEQSQGFLSDHYDPRHKVLRLSPQVFQGNSVASAGIAAHEAGHALQDAKGYMPLSSAQVSSHSPPSAKPPCSSSSADSSWAASAQAQAADSEQCSSGAASSPSASPCSSNSSHSQSSSTLQNAPKTSSKQQVSSNKANSQRP